MLNSPCNPDRHRLHPPGAGSAWPTSCWTHDLAVLSDEIYEQLVFGDAKATCFATLRPGLAERTITISGVSKSYAMTGWRMGWAVGPVHVIKAMGNVQSQQTSNPCSISQYAALAALEGDQECVEQMRREFEARRDLVCRRLAELPGVSLATPEGAFYAFFDVSATSAGPWAAAGSPTRRRSARRRWKRPTSTWCPARHLEPRGMCGCRLPPAANRSMAAWTGWRSC